jgi:hypothetical protein
MAAPAHTVHGTPPGKELRDGVGTTIVFALVPNVNFWETELTPPGREGGEPIDNTSLLNTVYRTRRAPVLVEGVIISGSAKYDPKITSDLNNLLNKEGACTLWWPDGSYYDFFGYLKSWKYDGHKEKTLPTAKFEIVQTFWDPVNGVEAAGVYHDAPGT